MRLSRLELSSVTASDLGEGLYRIRYHAWLPVAWGDRVSMPSSFTFRLPRRIDRAGQSTFLAAYGTVCNDGDDAAVTH